MRRRAGTEISPRANAPVRPTAKKPSRRRTAVNMIVMTFAAGLVATMALPAYAFAPSGDHSNTRQSVDANRAAPQSVVLSSDAKPVVIKRESVSATSKQELAEQQAREQAAERVEEQRSTYQAAYSGPSVADFLKNPPYPDFSLSQVFNVAKQYIGTPYVFGGASPAGFDCSGYVMFVYAQFGISLPHSVSGEAAAGKRISIEDAVPGDLVIMPGHDGFYAGNGNIMDAPDTGRSISIRPIWTDNYYIVRLGI